MLERVQAFDARVDALFDHWRGNAVTDRLFYAASELGDFGLVWGVLASARGLRPGRRHERAAVRALAGLGIESVLVNVGIKSLFGRGRPRRADPHPHRLRQPLTSSFPSGHATAAFCSAMLLSEDDPLAPLYFATAVVVASSRVYVKIHHPSDVAAGVVIGLALGWIGRRLVPLDPREAR